MDNIKKLRKKKGYTQTFLGEKLNMSQQSYGNLESSSDDFKVSHLKVMSELYECSINYLLGEENDFPKKRELQKIFKEVTERVYPKPCKE